MRRTLAATAVMGALLVACGPGPGAPSASEWSAVWVRTRDTLLDPSAFVGSDEEAHHRCGEALGRIHEARRALHPAPDEVLGAAADTWLSFAAQMMFECPVRDDRYAGFASGFVHLRRLAAEVDAALAAPEAPPETPSA